jgi:hypothetical protein
MVDDDYQVLMNEAADRALQYSRVYTIARGPDDS